MSDKQDSNKDVVKNLDGKSEEVDNKPTKSPKVDSQPPVSRAKKPQGSNKGSSAVAWLALLLVIAVAGAGVWAGRELLRKEADIGGRIDGLEALASAENTELTTLFATLEKRLASESVRGRAKGSAEAAVQADKLKAFERRLTAQREDIIRFGATDRKDWQLAEAQYLLRLANQRLIMSDDLVAAKALLRSADNILVELQDVTLHEVRGAVAADLAAVRAVPKRDIEGMYLELAALIEQADKLAIFKMPEVESPAPVEPAEDWQGRLQQGYEAGLLKLSEYIIINRRDAPTGALMEPQWESLVRQNLRMLLEQAQVALLSGNQTLFGESLGRAKHWLEAFFSADEAAAQAVAKEISKLMDKDIAVDMPDISRSLIALDAALKLRTERGGIE